MLDNLRHILPVSLQSILGRLPPGRWETAEEIRVRESRPLELVGGGGYVFITSAGRPAESPGQAYRPTGEDCRQLLDLLTNHSMYTHEEGLKRGYITVRGGHRVGLAGRAVLERSEVRQIKDIAGFNIRIARERPGIGSPLLPLLLDETVGSICHTLIVSPPQQGKTTLLRDLARLISSGDGRRQGLKVGIVDERSELAACYRGVPVFDVGPRTDVLDACPKAEGMMMMIRSMSPQLLVVDEIGRQEDADAIREALHAGVKVMATVHGLDLEEIRRRPVLSRIMNDGVFERFVFLKRPPGSGLKAEFRVLDRSGRRLTEPVSAGGLPC